MSWIDGIDLDILYDKAKAFDAIEEKDLHVIGTCGECKYWEEMEEGPLGCCKKDQCGSNATQCFPNFGCIHFEKKED